MRKTMMLAALAMGLTMPALPGAAEPFSTQSFSGGSSSMDELPGVRYDRAGMDGPDLNCTDNPTMPHGPRNRTLGGTTRECTVGSFTFSTTTQQNPFQPTQHNQFGYQPQLGWEQWRP
jgi:hypothetical protein